ncbi:SpoIIE family protein phosphatase [Bacteroidota bacterium]
MISKFKSTILIFLVFFCFSETYSQNGTPFLTHFKECKEIETQNWAISQDNQNVMLFANRRGILTFDGQNWDIIKLPFIPFALKKSPLDNKVYVGANNNYGYLERNSKGFIEYKSLLSDTLDIGIITKIIFTDTTIFFYGENTITRHSATNPEIFKRWQAKSSKPFTGMFNTQKNTFFNVHGEGLYRLESDTLFPIVTGYYTENSEILFSLPYNDKRVLVGTDDSKLYTFDGIKYYSFDINDEGYLQESILADGQIISDTLYAFGTLYGGVEIVNKKTGKIVYTVNYQNGLPDDEIYALGLDNNNGLWVTHEFGVSRVDFSLPIRNYTTYPGIKGNLISSLWHNNELYVATNEGVYYLSEVKDFNEIDVWVKTSPVHRKTSTASKSTTESTKTQESEVKKSAKKLFSKIFAKKTEKEKDKEIKPETSEKSTVKPKKTTTKPSYVKKTVSKLKSINYIFKKIEGLNDKCNQLVSTDHGILAATNDGLYHIIDHNVKEIAGNRYINQISNKTSNASYFISAADGLFSIVYKNKKWQPEYRFVDFNESIFTINILNENKAWLGGDNQVYSFLIDSLGEPKNFEFYYVKTDFPENYQLDYFNDSLFLFLESGLFYYDTKINSFEQYKPEHIDLGSRYKFLLNQQNYPWIKTDNQWICLNSNNVWSEQEKSILKLFDDISSIVSDENQNIWIINNNNQLYKIDHSKFRVLSPDFNIFFNKIKNEEGNIFELSDLTFNPENKAIYVRIIAPYYIKKSSTQYQYYVEGLMNDWSEWNTNQDINLIVESGTYTLHVRAKDIWDNRSEIKSVQFTIKPPFTESFWFYVLIAIAAIGIFIGISKIRERKLIHDKRILEQKVKERTIEIQEKAEEIEAQRDEITVQRDEILNQKEEITASINYAKRIQNAVLPLKDHFEKAFSDHFIMFKPRDIVSGDFYWIAEDQDKLYFTAADCTGHGVPGAFMSMLGVSSLNEIFGNENNNITANRILELLREKIKFSLHQTGKEGENKDGMDMAMCIYHKKKKMIEYAGAYNPLYLIRNGELQEYKADRMPIGIYHVEKENFTNHEIKVKKGDNIYIFSDGYVDQFGGPAQNKFKSVNMKKLLAEIWDKPMNEQKQILEDRFNKWKGKLDQIDDIIFIGIKF